jgi:hypothetical protein
MPRQVLTYAATVPLSGTTSDPVAVIGAKRLGVLFPAVTSATWYVQVSHTSSPADFRRVLKSDGSGGPHPCRGARVAGSDCGRCCRGLPLRPA